MAASERPMPYPNGAARGHPCTCGGGGTVITRTHRHAHTRNTVLVVPGTSRTAAEASQCLLGDVDCRTRVSEAGRTGPGCNHSCTQNPREHARLFRDTRGCSSTPTSHQRLSPLVHDRGELGKAFFVFLLFASSDSRTGFFFECVSFATLRAPDLVVCAATVPRSSLGTGIFGLYFRTCRDGIAR